MMDLEEQFNFTNKLKHPTNHHKTVYRHLNAEQAQYFAELLGEHNIEFEYQVDDEHPKKPHYFGVSVLTEKKVDRLNFLALGKNRDKFIASPAMRWVIIVISMTILITAIIGAIVS